MENDNLRQFLKKAEELIDTYLDTDKLKDNIDNLKRWLYNNYPSLQSYIDTFIDLLYNMIQYTLQLVTNQCNYIFQSNLSSNTFYLYGEQSNIFNFEVVVIQIKYIRLFPI
jgi:hypothetical protein